MIRSHNPLICSNVLKHFHSDSDTCLEHFQLLDASNCPDNALGIKIDVQSGKNTCSLTQCAEVPEQQQENI